MVKALPLVSGGRTWAVPSKSDPGTYHIVRLAEDKCDCRRCQFRRYEDDLCQPKKDALEMEQLQRELQAKMPSVTAKEKSRIFGTPHLPRVDGMTDEEVRAIFS